MSKQVEISSIPAIYLSAITNKDLDGIMSLYADNAMVEDPIGSEPYVGIDAGVLG